MIADQLPVLTELFLEMPQLKSFAYNLNTSLNLSLLMQKPCSNCTGAVIYADICTKTFKTNIVAPLCKINTDC